MIKNVAVAAERTFARGSEEGFKENYESLRKLVSRLNASHVGLTKDQIISCSVARNFRMTPTATTIHVHENTNFSIGVFILGKDKKIPLHDHPNMFGMIKCIHGTLQIKSYSPLPTAGTYTVPSKITDKIPRNMFETLTPCKLSDEKLVMATDDTVCSLDPANGNIHEIIAIDGPAAFIDILSPPYNGVERDCTYYTQIEGTENENDITWLMPTQPPQEYWTRPAEYCGPSIVQSLLKYHDHNQGILKLIMFLKLDVIESTVDRE